MTGQWGEKAYKECQKYGSASLACNTKSSKFTSIPGKQDWKLDAESAFVHYCANETVNGVEWHSTPDVGLTAEQRILAQHAKPRTCPHSVLVCRRGSRPENGQV